MLNYPWYTWIILAGSSEFKNALETLEYLENTGEIKRDDVASLFDALKLIGRVDLQKKVKAFEREYSTAGEDSTVKRPRSNYDDFDYPFNQGM